MNLSPISKADFENIKTFCDACHVIETAEGNQTEHYTTKGQISIVTRYNRNTQEHTYFVNKK